MTIEKNEKLVKYIFYDRGSIETLLAKLFIM